MMDVHVNWIPAAPVTPASTTDVLLVAAGPVTTIPLILFTLGARRLPLSTVGVLQYIAPTCNFLLAVFFYGETFTAVHGVAFSCIWIALAIYTVDLRRALAAQERPES